MGLALDTGESKHDPWTSSMGVIGGLVRCGILGHAQDPLQNQKPRFINTPVLRGAASARKARRDLDSIFGGGRDHLAPSKGLRNPEL